MRFLTLPSTLQSQPTTPSPRSAAVTDMSYPVAKIPELVQNLHKVFQTRKTSNKEWAKSQLLALKRALTENKQSARLQALSLR